MSNYYYKILVILRPSGGITTFCKYLYKNIDYTKYEITFIAPECNEAHNLSEEFKDYRVEFKYLSTNEPFCKLSFVGIAVEILSNKYDLVHSHGYTAGMFSALPAFITGTPHIMTAHSMLSLEDFIGLQGTIKKHIINMLLNKIKTIHCVSEDAATNITEFFPKHKNKIKVIESGIDTELFLVYESKDLRVKYRYDNNTFLVGYFGRYMPVKGFIYLIEALEILIQYGSSRKPIIMCWGGGGYLVNYKKTILEKGLNDYFKFLPYEENIGPAIKGLDVVVMPSLIEAFGLLSIETLIAGTPLIASNCKGSKCTLMNTAATVIPMGDSLSLANALLIEMENPSRSKVIANKDYLLSRFDIKRVATEVQQIYRDLVT